MKSTQETQNIKVLRTVTVAEAVPFHLRNILKYTTQQLNTVVVGTEVERLQPQFPAVRFINATIPRQISLFRDFLGLIQLIRIISKEQPDVTHSIMPKSGLLTAVAAYLCRVPIRMHTFTGQTWANYSGLKRSLFILIDKIVVTLNSVCLTDSPSQSQFLFENGINKNGKPLAVLGNGSLSGIDLDVFNRSALAEQTEKLQQKLSLTAQDFVYVFVGRKCRDKGVFDLIDAFNLLTDQNLKLLLVGPDESDGELEKYLKNDPRILNLPQTDQPQLFLCLGQVFCIPSYREGFGSTVIEAAALGLPTIGTNIPGLRDSIKDGKTGLLVDVQNVNQLSEAMKSLFENTRLRTELAENAYLYATKNFDAKQIANELLRLYDAKNP